MTIVSPYTPQHTTNQMGIHSPSDIALLKEVLDEISPFQIPEHIREQTINKMHSILSRQFVKDNNAIRAAQTIVKMVQVNVEMAKQFIPKRVEQNINVTKLSDEELNSALSEVLKRLPPCIT